MYSPSFPSVQWNVTQCLRHQLYTLICLEEARLHWATRSSWRLCFLIAGTLQKLLGGSHVIFPYCYFRGIIQTDKACLLMRYYKALSIPLSDWLVWQTHPSILDLNDFEIWSWTLCFCVCCNMTPAGFKRLDRNVKFQWKWILTNKCLSSSCWKSLDMWF